MSFSGGEHHGTAGNSAWNSASEPDVSPGCGRFAGSSPAFTEMAAAMLLAAALAPLVAAQDPRMAPLAAPVRRGSPLAPRRIFVRRAMLCLCRLCW